MNEESLPLNPITMTENIAPPISTTSLQSYNYLETSSGLDNDLEVLSSKSDKRINWRERIEKENEGVVYVNDFPQGYPRYSALLNSDKSFQVWRRFSTLRTRLLLLKQDELSRLEEQLENIDAEDEELFPIFLGNNREDTNQDRKEILKKIDIALNDYDSFLKRQYRTFNLESSRDRAISSLRNWHDNNKSLASEEIKYLNRRDLFTLLGNGSWSDRLIDLINGYFNTTKKPRRERSANIMEERMKQMIRVLQAALMAVLLFPPVIICNFVSNLTYRMIIIVGTTAIFIAILSLIARTRMKSFDLVIAGTTYATVLVVFISGTNGINN
ncbi:uncharacterized protein TrAFT101_005842 [Trichoderma asperellum]|uniref:uncharacterized protein n=1 Tax=Trichoderma asperellum TaxID=101201 RepID=UPI0033301A58|nr:hypothetical protein TrAFT101_005842 [Trichoderma asperellum]